MVTLTFYRPVPRACSRTISHILCTISVIPLPIHHPNIISGTIIPFQISLSIRLGYLLYIQSYKRRELVWFLLTILVLHSTGSIAGFLVVERCPTQTVLPILQCASVLILVHFRPDWSRCLFERVWTNSRRRFEFDEHVRKRARKGTATWSR